MITPPSTTQLQFVQYAALSTPPSPIAPIINFNTILTLPPRFFSRHLLNSPSIETIVTIVTIVTIATITSILHHLFIIS